MQSETMCIPIFWKYKILNSIRAQGVGRESTAESQLPAMATPPPKPPTVLIVEGLIGAGKSTLIRDVLLPELSRNHKVQVIREPVDEWVKSGLLQRFYGDKRRWSYSFQTKAFYDRIMEARTVMAERARLPVEEQADVVVMERSPLSDQIFMRTLHDEGAVDDLEYSMYQDWCHLWSLVLPFQISLFLYIRTDLDRCMARLQDRSRDGETGVSREYQAHLLREHDREFLRPVLDDGTACLVIDGAPDYRHDTVLRQQLVQQVARACRWQ